MVFKEIKDTHESKYPEKEFTAKLIELGIKPIGKNPPKPEVFLTFEGKEEPVELTIRGLEKMAEDGTISDFFQLGKFIASLRKHGIKPLIDVEGSRFKTEPAIVGKVLHMKPVNERTVTGEGGDKKYRDWIIEEIKNPGTTVTAPETAKPASLTPEQIQALKEKWESFVIESVTAPITRSDFWKMLKTKDPKMNPSQAWEVLEALKDTLKVGEGGKYSVV